MNQIELGLTWSLLKFESKYILSFTKIPFELIDYFVEATVSKEKLWNRRGSFRCYSEIKACSWEVCCHNARGRVRNRKSNPVSPRDWTYCLHKPECIATTNSDRSALIPNATWHFSFQPVNVCILNLKGEYGSRSENLSTCYSRCYVTWCPLILGIFASLFPSSRDDGRHTILPQWPQRVRTYNTRLM